ncbi:MAG: FixH family protein [Candidatus Diapherotrites archaeon]
MALFWIVLAAALASATTVSTTWIIPPGQAYAPQLDVNQCMSAVGDQNLVVRVYNPSNQLVSDATVSARILKPDSSTTNITFTSAGNGSYWYKFSFDQNGTYRLNIDANKANSGGSLVRNIFVYNFNLNVSFLNNGFFVNPGDTGILRALVRNDDGNAITNLSGDVNVFYPNSAPLLSSQTPTDVGNGEYGLSFTAPSTLGVYSASASFSCGAKSDSNSDGRFVVGSSGANFSPSFDANFFPTVGQSETFSVNLNNDGAGVSNASVSGTITKPDSSQSALSFSNVGGGNYAFNYLFDANGIYTLNINASGSATASLTDYVYVGTYGMTAVPQETAFSPSTSSTLQFYLHGSPPIKHGTATISVYYPSGAPFQTSTPIYETSTPGYYSYSFNSSPTLGSYSYIAAFHSGINSLSFGGTFSVSTTPSGTPVGTGGTGGGGGGIPARPKLSAENISIAPLSIGQTALISGQLKNSSSGSMDVVVQVIIQQGSEVEYIDERTYLGVQPYSTIPFTMLQSWTPKLAGSHLLSLTVFSLDKMSKYDVQSKTFSIEGELRYDLGIRCSTPETTAGLPVQFSITLYNLGDYFTDTQLSWRVEDPDGKIVLESSTPLAVRPKDDQVKDVLEVLPVSIPPGIYSAHARLDYISTPMGGTSQVRQASCSFTVKSQKNYYAEQANSLEVRLEEVQNELEALRGKGFLVQSLEQEVVSVQELLASVEDQIGRSEFEGVNEKILSISSRVDELEKNTKEVSVQALFGVSGAGQIILLVLIAAFVFGLSYFVVKKLQAGNFAKAKPERVLTFKKRFEVRKEGPEKKKVKRGNALDRLLGLED